ncbi:transmembrane protein 61 [Nannospalax galili]|uniref:transmembrane protein 61 n=1 Tax=Nannospalax galili TaxID=1026970 RepID=UPI0004ED2956|nr:transmembrane protein 61 [Nannospalax galili]
MTAREMCDRGRVASTVRYCMTVGGTVVLVVGTLCFAWWSEEGTAAPPGLLDPSAEHSVPEVPHPLLKSASFLCCGVGGLLLLFGLLWSIQDGRKGPLGGDLYRVSRDLHRLAVESSEKESCRAPKEVVIPTYEEAMHCPLVEGPPARPGQPEEEDLQCHDPGDALLGMLSLSSPPSYESVILTQGAISGPGSALSSPSSAETAEESQVPSRS